MTFPERLHYVKVPPAESWDFLTTIDWFSQCGIDSDVSREHAIGSISSPEWEDFTLERRNDITAHLAKKFRNRDSEWNKVAKGATAYAESEVFPRMLEAATEQGFDKAVVDQVKWDILSFIQEEIYASCGIPRFYHYLIDVYRRGRLPCGWSGTYPEGRPTAF